MLTLAELLARPHADLAPVWLVDFADNNLKLASNVVLGLDLDSYLRIIDEDGVKISAQTVDPLNGTASVGSATTVITDKARIFSDMLALAAGLPGAIATVKLGAREIHVSQYVGLFRGALDGAGLTRTHNAYELHLKDAIGQLSRKVFRSSSATVPVTIAGNPLDIALRVIVSTGTALAHGTYDVLAADNGLALDPAVWLDVAAIEAERDVWMTGAQMSFTIREPVDALSFIQEQILKPFSGHFIVTQAGLLSVRFMRPIALPETSTVIDETMIKTEHPPEINLQLDGETINQVIIRMDYNSATRNYDTTIPPYDDKDLQSFYGRVIPFEITSQGLRTALNGQAWADAAASRILRTFGYLQPRLPLDCKMRALLSPTVGSTALFSLKTLPATLSGGRSVRASNVRSLYFQIVPRFAAHQAAGTPDYTMQVDAQKLGGWSICSSVSGQMSNGDPGYSVCPDLFGRVVPTSNVDGVSLVPIQILKKDSNVMGHVVSFDARVLAQDPSRRYGKHAPSGTLDYTLETEVTQATRWFICSAATGTMSDGSRGYGVI